ncbi:FRG domain-containing protein [Rathayibacter festucae]|uniref:FRG domain-containing protein n=1 Tax=Rathayibacter festucae TaxID=110937 RepID=UPI001FB509EC|nr:FRG domain-containing protein [Rathayibacter festucae]MCJ1698566.1 FRG domain-containing protein [Rathayibacter festucae]
MTDAPEGADPDIEPEDEHPGSGVTASQSNRVTTDQGSSALTPSPTVESSAFIAQYLRDSTTFAKNFLDIQSSVSASNAQLSQILRATSQTTYDSADMTASIANQIRAARAALNSGFDFSAMKSINSVNAMIQQQLRPTLPSDFFGAGLSNLSAALTEALDYKTPAEPRAQRTALDFFSAFEVEVTSLKKLLSSLSILQQKNSDLGLVWRGQRDASWAIDSSLTRSLRQRGRDVGERQLNIVERFQVLSAEGWGISPVAGGLNFLAELQHEGVPTRLIDVSLDPEVAVWFAVQSSDEDDATDARLICWGRSAVPKRNGQIEKPPLVPDTGQNFWQRWESRQDRRENDWGTGRTVRSWQPAAMNERMRAQRAAFLFDAEPIIDDQLLELLNKELDGDWLPDEIAEATRIVGYPSTPTKRATRNSLQIVPMFTIRIAASAKEEIRAYLSRKGLTEESIYPDRAGLISYLKRSSTRVSKGSGPT